MILFFIFLIIHIYCDVFQVCSNHNETWPSDCEMYRQRCLCAEEEEGCTNPEYKHVHIDYYGHCQEIPVSKMVEYYSKNYFY